LYTLVIKPNQTYTVYIDQEDVANGTLIDDWNILAPKKIKDPKVTKPEDWVLEPMMDDPNDEKPEDWVSGPLFILDPNAVKPDDWDQEEDGDWTPPEIPNPDFKGEWQRKKIPNPNYKGEWVHPEIDNPDYKNDTEIYAYTSGFLGFDLWQVKSGTIFDNIIVTDSLEEAQKFAEETFVKYKADEKSAKEVIDKEQEEKLKLENEKFLKEQEEKRKQEEERLAKEQAEKLKQKKLSEEEEEEEEDEHPEL
jgi:calreticulin